MVWCVYVLDELKLEFWATEFEAVLSVFTIALLASINEIVLNWDIQCFTNFTNFWIGNFICYSFVLYFIILIYFILIYLFI